MDQSCPGISILACAHTHTHNFLFQSLFDSYKATSLSFSYVTPLHTNIQESIAQLLWLLSKPEDKIPVLYMTRGFNISPPDIMHGPVHTDTPRT